MGSLRDRSVCSSSKRQGRKIENKIKNLSYANKKCNAFRKRYSWKSLVTDIKMLKNILSSKGTKLKMNEVRRANRQLYIYTIGNACCLMAPRSWRCFSFILSSSSRFFCLEFLPRTPRFGGSITQQHQCCPRERERKRFIQPHHVGIPVSFFLFSRSIRFLCHVFSPFRFNKSIIFLSSPFFRLIFSFGWDFSMFDTVPSWLYVAAEI